MWEPIDDSSTVALLARGDTMGVFYVESPAMRMLQKKTGAGDYEHLVIHSSIIRPAANRFINEYIDRLKGKPYEPPSPLALRPPRGNLRNHVLPGGRLQSRGGPRRIHPRRGGRHQEDPLQEGCHDAARGLPGAIPRRRFGEGGGRRHYRDSLGDDGILRRLLLREGALGELRHALLPFGLPARPPSRRVHGRRHVQPRRILLDPRLREREPEDGVAPAAPRPERERRPLLGKGGIRSASDYP